MCSSDLFPSHDSWGHGWHEIRGGNCILNSKTSGRLDLSLHPSPQGEGLRSRTGGGGWILRNENFLLSDIEDEWTDNWKIKVHY